MSNPLRPTHFYWHTLVFKEDLRTLQSFTEQRLALLEYSYMVQSPKATTEFFENTRIIMNTSYESNSATRMDSLSDTVVALQMTEFSMADSRKFSKMASTLLAEFTLFLDFPTRLSEPSRVGSWHHLCTKTV